MDLRNNQITVRELLADPKARQVLARQFPQVRVCIMKSVDFVMIMQVCLSVCKWLLTVEIYRKLTEFTMKFWSKPIINCVQISTLTLI